MEIGESVIPTITTISVDGPVENDGPHNNASDAATRLALSVDQATSGFETISRQSSTQGEPSFSTSALNPFRIGLRSKVMSPFHLQSKAESTSVGSEISGAFDFAFENYQTETTPKLYKQFQTQHGRNADPAQILDLAQRLHGVHKDDLWLCFSLVEPAMAFYLEECYREILIIDAMLRSSPEYATVKLENDWKLRWISPMDVLVRNGPSAARWYGVRSKFPAVQIAWQRFLEADKPNIDLCNLSKVRSNIVKLVEFIREQDSAMEEAEEAARMEAQGQLLHRVT